MRERVKWSRQNSAIYQQSLKRKQAFIVSTISFSLFLKIRVRIADSAKLESQIYLRSVRRHIKIDLFQVINNSCHLKKCFTISYTGSFLGHFFTFYNGRLRLKEMLIWKISGMDNWAGMVLYIVFGKYVTFQSVNPHKTLFNYW